MNGVSKQTNRPAGPPAGLHSALLEMPPTLLEFFLSIDNNAAPRSGLVVYGVSSESEPGTARTACDDRSGLRFRPVWSFFFFLNSILLIVVGFWSETGRRTA